MNLKSDMFRPRRPPSVNHWKSKYCKTVYHLNGILFCNNLTPNDLQREGSTDASVNPSYSFTVCPGYSGLADDAPESDILTDFAFFPYMIEDAPDIEPLMLPVQSTQTRLAPETDTSISSEDTLEL